MNLFGKRPQSPRPAPKEPQKSPAPEGLFGEKKEWPRDELSRRLRKASPFIPGTGKGRFYTRTERGKMIDEIFPRSRFQGYISEIEAKTRLKEIRTEEHRARTGDEKTKLSRMRRYLEQEFGLQGKY